MLQAGNTAAAGAPAAFARLTGHLPRPLEGFIPAARGADLRRRALADWCVAEPWFARAAPDAKLMHCLPVRRDVVVSAALLDSPRSAVVRQAHTRLYAQMAVLHRLLAA